MIATFQIAEIAAELSAGAAGLVNLAPPILNARDGAGPASPAQLD